MGWSGYQCQCDPSIKESGQTSSTYTIGNKNLQGKDIKTEKINFFFECRLNYKLVQVTASSLYCVQFVCIISKKFLRNNYRKFSGKRFSQNFFVKKYCRYVLDFSVPKKLGKINLENVLC